MPRLCQCCLTTGTGTSAYPYFANVLNDVSRWVTRQGCSGTVLQTYNDYTAFSNIVWPNCRNGRVVELMSVQGGVHQWWTQQQGGFETTEYVFRWFDLAHGNQAAADAERAK